MRPKLELRWNEAIEQIERFAIDVVYDRRTGRLEAITAALLRTLSWLFRVIVMLRYFLYRKRILRDSFLGCLVVAVGNLTVGGTGKTPVVEIFARNLAQRGRRVAILSRGYGSKSEKGLVRFIRWLTHSAPPPPRVVSDGETIFLTAEEAGDEPVMLARNLPGVAVIVDKDRVKAGQYAIRKFGADVLLLDDGFQYLPLRGQLNLLLIDKTNPFGNGQLLPRGILREPVSHMKRASYVFLTKSDGSGPGEIASVIERYKPECEIIECTHKPQFLQECFSQNRLPLNAMNSLPVAAFSGIAVPESFEGFLQRYGAKIVFNRRFIDHHRFNQFELERIYNQARAAGASMIVTTEKDAVRVLPEWRPHFIPLYFLRLEVELISGARDFHEAVSRICFPGTGGRERASK